MFALFYSADEKKIRGINGSGRTASKASLELIRTKLAIEDGVVGGIPMASVHAVTTPGAAAGWVDAVELFGNHKLTLDQILAPAIELAEEGFPVAEVSSFFWQAEEDRLRRASPNFRELMRRDPTAKDGWRAPRPGELFTNPALADTFRLLAKGGKRGFYRGQVAEAIVKVVQDADGLLDLVDLESHLETGSEQVDPIRLRFDAGCIARVQKDTYGGAQEQAAGDDGVDVWECPPNGQGLVALMALGILEQLEKQGRIPRFKQADHNSAEYLHAVIEALRISFSDSRWWISDPAFTDIPVTDLLSPDYLGRQAKLFDPKRASSGTRQVSPAQTPSDTVYFAVTDRWGNGMSFINSNYAGFGSSIIPAGCGFTLHNRGASFSLDKEHPNAFAPKKRPYHTIIPAMVTLPEDGSLHTIFGVVGGFMQPQGHVQVLLNMLAFKHNPQAALDAPRICVGAGTPAPGEAQDNTVYLENGIDPAVAWQLRLLGHDVQYVTGWKRCLFGRGQVIRLHVEDGTIVYSGGSDPRGDGAAIPY